jgi:hypothetical protein
MTSRRKDLIAALTMVQSHPVHNHHDIVSIHCCAPLSTEVELQAAIEANMAQIARWSNYGGSKRRLARAPVERAAAVPAPKAKNEILIHLGEQGWQATFTGPHAARIEKLFDSNTIPTAFTARAPLATVIAEVQSRNPGVVVRHWNA